MGSAVYRSERPEAARESDDWLEVEILVDPNHDGARVDRFLSDRIARLSRVRVRQIIEEGNVCAADGVPILRPAQRVRAGDVLILHRPVPIEPPVVMDYRVLHCDDALMVLDKPAGLPVHPSARYHRNTLTALLRDRLGADHPWVMAHRLDRETSGVLAFGHRGPGSAALKRAFQDRVVTKVYFALVHGTVQSALTIDVPLGPAANSAIRIKMGPRALGDGGLTARTDVEPVGYGTFRRGDVTLIRALPRTGRQHQIRAHLAHAGHGVVGDKLYGLDERHFIDVVDHGRPMQDLEAELGLHRHALHAASLTLPHPSTGDRITVSAEWPPDLAEVLPVP